MNTEIKKGGFRKISDPTEMGKNVCKSEEHNPPMGIFLEGGIYEYSCPKCKKITIVRIPVVTF